MDDVSQIFALATEFKAHGKAWRVVQTVCPLEEGSWVLAVEKNGTSPIPACLVWKQKDHRNETL